MKPTHQAITICGQTVKGVQHEEDGKSYILVYFEGVNTTAHWEVQPESIQKLEGEAV